MGFQPSRNPPRPPSVVEFGINDVEVDWEVAGETMGVADTIQRSMSKAMTEWLERSEWKEVSEEEMRTFIANFPAPLESDTCFIVEPPQRTFNLIVGGEAWPMASYYDDYLEGNQRHCFIRVKKNSEDSR